MSTSKRTLIKRIIAREPVDRCGLWLGNPQPETWTNMHNHFGTTSEEELRSKVGDDVRWYSPQFYADAYQDPDGGEMFDISLDREKHGSAGPLSDCESVAEVKKYPLPKPECIASVGIGQWPRIVKDSF